MKCFACGKKIKGMPYKADTRDDQTVFVGPKCYTYIMLAKDDGYQPPLGGPKLYVPK
jgi:hypothetical protein